MNSLTLNDSDISIFLCTDCYLAKYLDNNLDKKIIDELSNERLSIIIPKMKNWYKLLDILGNRIRDVINEIDIYFLRKFVIFNKKYYEFLNEYNKTLLFQTLKYGDEYMGYYISNKNIFYDDELSFDVIKKINNATNLIFVKDRKEKYLGICYLKHLIKENVQISKYIKKNYPKVEANLHTSDFIRYNHRYYIEAYPILDGDKLIGVLSNKGLNDLLEFEMNDDYYKLAGITENRLNTDNEHLGRKLPWLFVAIFTNFAFSMLFSTFLGLVERIPILPLYLSTILIVSNAVGFQSLGASIGYIRKENVTTVSSLKIVYNEIKKSIIIGLVLSIISFVLIYFFTTFFKISYFDTVYFNSDSLKFSADFTLILFVDVIISSIVGFCIPLIINKLDYDYSIASSILIISIINILASSMFFLFFSILV